MIEKIVWSLLTISLIAGTEDYYRDSLFNYSLGLIVKLQSMQTARQMKALEISSDIIDETVKYFPLVLCFTFTKQLRSRAFYYVCILTIHFSLVNLLKSSYH